ncbi:PEP-CTERM sorting domain-containing protein [Massilia antarctica]|nr:PEP-CTERM sorting domain-containing protein [Massilia antarctica]
MKKLLAAVFVASALVSQGASAAIQTYTFSGVVGSMSSRIMVDGPWGPDYEWHDIPSAQSWTYKSISVGERFSGTVSFDDALVKTGGGTGSYSMMFANGEKASAVDERLEGYGGFHTGFRLWGPYVGLEFDVAGLFTPGQPVVLTAQGASVGASWSPSAGGGGYVSFSGKLDSLVNVTAVPEPSTYAMLLGGLMLVGARARRLRARRSA